MPINMPGSLSPAEQPTPVAPPPIQRPDTLSDIEADIRVLYEFPLRLRDSRFGGFGNGLDDDTPAIDRIRAHPAPYGREILWEPGRWKDTKQRIFASGENWTGAGGILDANERGVSTYETSFNGEAVVIPANCANWSIEKMTLKGQRTLALQDLLACKQTGHGAVRRVGIINAGRDNVTLAASLNIQFDVVYHALAKRYNLLTSGQANANQWNKCLFRVADSWGIRIGGGIDLTFIDPTIESNNQGGNAGGMLLDPNDPDASAYIGVNLVGAHFENNSPVTGRPVESLVGTRGFTFAEMGSQYAETGACRFAAPGTIYSAGIGVNAGPHAIIEPNVSSTWVAPVKRGGGVFSLTDNSGMAVILANALPAAGRPGIRIGDLELFRDVNGHLQSGALGRRLLVKGGFGSGNTLVATGPVGAVVRKMEVFDDGGGSVGFVPIYGTIT